MFHIIIKQFPVIGNIGWLGIGLIMLSMYYLIDPWLMSFWPFLVATFIYGCMLSLPMIQFDIVIIELFGVDKLGLALGLDGLIAGVSRILSLYFPGKE